MRLLSAMATIRVANSTPIVLFSSVVKLLRVKRERRLDFPTPLSPTWLHVSAIQHPSNFYNDKEQKIKFVAKAI
jgi:hypothetical protein